MTPAAIIAAIDRLSSFDLARLLESSDFWDVLGCDGALLERAEVYEICDELGDRFLTPDTIERLRELIEDAEAIEQAVAPAVAVESAP